MGLLFVAEAAGHGRGVRPPTVTPGGAWRTPTGGAGAADRLLTNNTGRLGGPAAVSRCCGGWKTKSQRRWQKTTSGRWACMGSSAWLASERPAASSGSSNFSWAHQAMEGRVCPTAAIGEYREAQMLSRVVRRGLLAEHESEESPVGCQTARLSADDSGFAMGTPPPAVGKAASSPLPTDRTPAH